MPITSWISLIQFPNIGPTVSIEVIPTTTGPISTTGTVSTSGPISTTSTNGGGKLG